MSEEVTVPTTTDEEVTEAPATVSEDDGVDAALLAKFKALDPEVLKNMENLSEFQKRVNRKSMEAAEAMKRAEAALASAQTPTGADDDDDEELTEEAQRILDKRIMRVFQNELAPIFSNLDEERREAQARIWEGFTEGHADVPADAIVTQFYELGLDKTSTTPAKYEAALNKAYKAAKADTLDIDALVAQKVQERLAELKKGSDDGDVVAIREKKSHIEAAPRTAGDIVNDADIPWYKKLEILNR